MAGNDVQVTGDTPQASRPGQFRRRARFTVAVWLAAMALVARAASAQDSPAGSTVTYEQPAAPADDQTAAAAGTPAAQAALDVGDLWRMVRRQPLTSASPRKRFLVAAPSIGSKPTTGLTVGLSTSMAFYSGDPKDTRISSFSSGIKVSENKQTNFGSRLSVFTDHDRWYLLADNRLAWTSLGTYTLGTGTSATAGAANAKFNDVKAYESVFRSIRPGLFVGGGVNVSEHYDIRPGSSSAATWAKSSFLAYSDAKGLASTRQKSSGTSIALRLDTRDNSINPEKGWLGSATYRTFFRGFLGGDSAWQELALDVRTYHKLDDNGRQKLAFWFQGDMVTNGTAPFFDLPTTGADGRSARGYKEGRYRGTQLLYAETEYRATLTRNGLLGMVLFANATNVNDGNGLFKSVAPAGGLGMRVLLNKRSRTNLCTDYGWGRQGSHGFYLSIQEAF